MTLKRYKRNLQKRLERKSQASGIAEQKRYVQNPGIKIREVDDAAFLVNSSNDSLYHLNQMGRAVWNLLADSITINEAAAIVHQAFPGISVKKARKDIALLLAELEENGLAAAKPDLNGGKINTT